MLYLSEKSNGGTKEATSLPTDAEQQLVLRNVTLRIPRHTLYAACGAVGSGKSSLLHAIIGIVR